MPSSKNTKSVRSKVAARKRRDAVAAVLEAIEPRILFTTITSFTPGDIVVYRVGTGSAALSSAATAVYLDEYTPGGTLVGSMAMPTTAGTAPASNPLTSSGTAGSEGMLTASANGNYLLVPGYDAAAGLASIASTVTAGSVTGATNATPIVITTSSTTGMNGLPVTITGVGGNTAANGTYFADVLNSTTFSLYTGYSGGAFSGPVAGTAAYTSGGTFTVGGNYREVGVVSANGTINTTTTLGTALSGNNIRSAASQDGTALYAAGANGDFLTSEGSTSNATSLGTLNSRQIEIVNGQLYISDNSGATEGIVATTPALPTGTATSTLVAGDPSDNGPYSYYFATLKAGDTSPDTLYVADNSAGITKYSLVNGSWVINNDTANVTAESYTTTTVTITANNDFTTGEVVSIPYSLGSKYYGGSGTFTIATASPTQFTYAYTNTSSASGTVTGTVVAAVATASNDAAFDGLTGSISNGVVTLYATTNAGHIETLTDSSGWNAAPSSYTPTILASAGTNTAFRGIAFAPTALVAPTVTSISPSAGGTSGGTVVTINGTEFTNTSTVNFGGAAAANVTYISPFQITAVAPAESTATVDVTVTNSAGTSTTSSADQYTYNVAPSISSLGTTAGPTSGTTSVVITGTGFTGATAVSFGSVAAASFTVNSATQITAIAPAETAGSVYVSVTTSNGTSTNSASDQYTYVAAPTVTGLNISQGLDTGGMTVTITGTGFNSGATVFFGGVAATGVTVKNSTTITAVDPAEAAGTVVDVTVNSVGGTSATSAADKFTYETANIRNAVAVAEILGSKVAFPVTFDTTPTVSQLLQTPGTTSGKTYGSWEFLVNDGTGSVEIYNASSTLPVPTGASYAPYSPALGDDITATGVFELYNGIVQLTPTSTAGSIALVSQGNTVPAVQTVTIPQLTPATLPASLASQVVTIKGVDISGISGTFGTSNLAGTITDTSGNSMELYYYESSFSTAFGNLDGQPIPTSNLVDVTGVVSNYNPNELDVLSITSPSTVAPIVSSVSPAAGSTTGGNTVTINGFGFTGTTAVNFGSTPATIVNTTDTQLTVTAPAESTGTVDVTVTNENGTSATSSADKYTYTVAPVLSFDSGNVYTVNENAGTETITVDRINSLSTPVSVNFTIGGAGDTAVAGTNYGSTVTVSSGTVSGDTGTLTFPANVTQETITIPIDAPIPQGGNKTLTVALSNPSSGAILNTPTSETVTIVDTQEIFNLSSATYSANDTDATAVVSILRSGPDTADAGTVPILVNGTQAGTATFAAGQLVAAATFPITSTGANQSLTVAIGPVNTFTGFTGSPQLGSLTSANYTIVDAAAPAGTTTINGIPSADGNIETTADYGENYATVVGDANAGTGSFGYLGYEILEFSPTTSPSLYPISGTTVNSLADMTLGLYDTNANTHTHGAPYNYGGVQGNFNVYFIPDSDSTTPTTGLRFSTANPPSGLNSSQFTSAPVLIGTFSFNNNNNDGTAGYAYFTPASIPSSVQTAILNDLNGTVPGQSGQQPFRLAVTPQTSGAGAIAADWGAIGAPSTEIPTLSFAATETTTQTPEYISFAASSYSESEAGPATTITLTRSGPVTDTATVDVTTSGGSAVAGTNYTALANYPVTFATGSATATFTVSPIDANPQNGDKVVYLSLSSPSTGSSSNVGILASPSTASLTIQDTSTAPTETLSPTIAGEADVEVGGIYDDTEFKATAKGGTTAPYASFSVADFSPATPSATITAIDSVTLTATLGTIEAPAAGQLAFYLVSDNTSSIAATTPESTANGYYNSANGVEGIGSQFGTKYLLGTYNLTDTTEGDTLTIQLAPGSAAATALISALNGTSNFRIAMTPEDGNVVADFVAGSLTLSAKVQEGTVVPTLPGWLTVSNGGQVNWNQSAETLEVVSGTATIAADPNESAFNSGAGDEPVITVDNGATLSIAPTDGSLMVHIGGLTLASGATAVVQQLQGPSTYDQMIGEFVASGDASNHEVLVIGKLGAANDPTFSIDPNSTLNLENNDLIIHTGSNDAGGYSELAAIQALAYGTGGGRAGGAWNGKELTSSVAKAQDYSDGIESVQLAVVDNSDLGSPFNTTSNKYSVGIASEGLNANGDIIVKYTYTGDFNLAGSVSAADANIFDLYYDAGASTGNEWAFGDTNNDGKLNATDANILGLDYGNGTANGTDPYQL